MSTKEEKLQELHRKSWKHILIDFAFSIGLILIVCSFYLNNMLLLPVMFAWTLLWSSLMHNRRVVEKLNARISDLEEKLEKK